MDEIKRILVIGSGTMGHGIAQVFAQGGYEVALQDTMPEALDRAKKLIQCSLDTMVLAGVLKGSDVQPVFNRIRMTESLQEAAADADLAIECITEDKEAKIELFKRLDAACPSRTLLASNTSFLNIFEFLDTPRPDKTLIIHMYAPPQIIPLVDIVKGPRTQDVYVQKVVKLLKGLGKKPIVFHKQIAGYLVSRLQVSFQREVYWLLDNDYLSPRDVDEAAIWGLAMRMLVLGICQRMDFGGLDLSARTISQAPAQSTPVDYKPQRLLDLVKQGALGVKTGRGFYDYTGKTEAAMCRERDIRLWKLFQLLQENDVAGPIS
jgi:3-hydroxybutyryl-CoA dehydrogenase